MNKENDKIACPFSYSIVGLLEEKIRSLETKLAQLEKDFEQFKYIYRAITEDN